ncbi:hypothetical protein ACOMHN_020792 [Nucella lapillus]
MATTSHGLSVYVNSCVKNPHLSKTRASATFPKGNLKQTRFADTDPGPYFDVREEYEEKDLNGLDISAPVRASLDDLETQLTTLKDEHFYLKLQELKESNRKTLEECARLYQEKYEGKGGQIGERAAKDLVENMFAARLAARSGHVEEERVANDEMTSGYGHSKGMGLSSKPPPVPSSRRESPLSKTSPARSMAIHIAHSQSVKPRPSSAPMHSNQYVRRSYSLDDDDWRRAMQGSSDFSDDDDVQSEGPLDPKAEAAIHRIRDMWQGFRIDDYSPSDQRASSSTLAGKQRKADLADGWRHRITIPKPFQMTVRDSSKMKNKTKAQLELERMRLEQQRSEEEECQKKFQAQPAPAHIYLPLYDEIQEKNEARRRFVKQHCTELLKSQEKPFNFVKREEEKKQQRMRSTTIAERLAQSVQKSKKKEKFVAKPIPKSIYSDIPKDKLLEEEEYRKIRIKLRSRELLREASLPPNMEAHQKLREQKEREKLLKSKQKTRSKRRPKSAHCVPDYDHMYREFQKEMARRKHTKESTVVEPFSFETKSLRSGHDQVLRDMERDDKLMKDTARGTPRLTLGVLSSSMDSIPMRTTASTELRTGYFRSLRERELRQREEEREEERRRRVRESKLRKYITERGGEVPVADSVVKSKIKQRRAAEIARLEQYEKDLEDMRSRVEKRPLLFEKETQSNAGKAAEKKFQTTLKTAGIDEEFIRTRSSGAHSDDNYEDDYEKEN